MAPLVHHAERDLRVGIALLGEWPQVPQRRWVEASRVASIVEVYRKTLETSELEARLFSVYCGGVGSASVADRDWVNLSSAHFVFLADTFTG